MATRPKRALTGTELERLEGRLVLNATANPVHHLAAAHPAQVHVASTHPTTHKVPAIPNPVLINLSPGSTEIKVTDVTYDSRINLITVKGTVDVTQQLPSPVFGYPPPTYPDTDYININVTQAVTQFRSVYGYQSTTAGIADATVTTVPFKTQILASPGKFTSGEAVLTLSAYRGYDYAYSTETLIVHMRPVKAF